MPHIDRNARAVLVAIWKAGAKDRRDVEGADFMAELGHEIEERTLYDLMFGLRDEGLIEVYMSGSHAVADMSLIRLTSLARELVAQWPESGERALEPDQERLLVNLVEAARAVPRHEQQWHLGGEYLASNVMKGPWGERQVLVSDIDALAELGLLNAVHRSGIYGNDYVITPAGHEYYAALKRRIAEPLARQEDAVRAFIDSGALREKCPLAYEKWSEAEELLWSAESAKELSTIGHKIREASHEFAIALVAEYEPSDVDPDIAKVKNRLRAVINLHRSELGETRSTFLVSLLNYWDHTVDLIQRQEHGRELTWQDARRVVFHTASLMFEITATLEELRVSHVPASSLVSPTEALRRSSE